MFKGIAFVFAACGVWVLVNAGNLQEFLDAYSRRNQELEQIEMLKDRISRLQRQEQSLASHGAESERQARERLNMHLPGERVILLKPEETTLTETAPVISTAHLPPPLPPEPPGEKVGTRGVSGKKRENSRNLKKPVGRE